jgi:CBS domain-containing protein
MARTSGRAVSRQVGEAMQRDYPQLAPEQRIGDAEQLLRSLHARHAAVVVEGRLLGVVSHRDLLDGLISRDRDAPVAHVMRSDPITVPETATLVEAAQRMLHFRIGCLPIVKRELRGDRLLGLLTESDLIRAAYGEP